MRRILKYGHVILVTGNSTRSLIEQNFIASGTWSGDGGVHINTCPIIMRTTNDKNFLDRNRANEDRGIVEFVSP